VSSAEPTLQSLRL